MRTPSSLITAIRLVINVDHSVAVKHYLRGEETIYYQDLYHLVKFLPVYILPAGRPSLSREDPTVNLNIDPFDQRAQAGEDIPMPTLASRRQATMPPLVKTTSATPPATLFGRPANIDIEKAGRAQDPDMLSPPLTQTSTHGGGLRRVSTANALLPASNPPKYALFDVFPFSLFVNLLVKKGKDVKGKKSAKIKARAGNVNHNIPLEITFYIVCNPCYHYKFELNAVDRSPRARTLPNFSVGRLWTSRPSVSDGTE